MIERALNFYQRWVSPVLHSLHGNTGACRFVPSCSEYAAGAVQQHGALLGAAFSAWRLLRCNPFSRGGFDPVPGTYSPGSRPQDESQDERLPVTLRDAAQALDGNARVSEGQR